MMYLAIGLAGLGTAVGLAFRWRVLLPIIVLMPFAVIIFSASHGATLKNVLITVLIAEALLQGGYFTGLFIRSVLSAGRRSIRAANLFGSRPVPRSRGNDQPVAPPEQAGKGQ
jgi:hypothetical protein